MEMYLLVYISFNTQLFKERFYSGSSVLATVLEINLGTADDINTFWFFYT